MNRDTFKRFKRGDRLEANEYNKVVRTVAQLSGSLHAQGFADSGGFHTRRAPGSTTGTFVRGVKIQAGGIPGNAIGPFVCKLLDSLGLEVGIDIDVWPSEHLGTNDFDSGNVHPNFAAADYMTIYKDLDGKWYTTFIFEDSIDCVCTAP